MDEPFVLYGFSISAENAGAIDASMTGVSEIVQPLGPVQVSVCFGLEQGRPFLVKFPCLGC